MVLILTRQGVRYLNVHATLSTAYLESIQLVHDGFVGTPGHLSPEMGGQLLEQVQVILHHSLAHPYLQCKQEERSAQAACMEAIHMGEQLLEQVQVNLHHGLAHLSCSNNNNSDNNSDTLQLMMR